jgi:ankyrin repeat protein
LNVEGSLTTALYNGSMSISSPEWDMLLSAAQKNWADRIREMILTDGVNPSHSNAVGQTALHIAALWGNGTSCQK